MKLCKSCWDRHKKEGWYMCGYTKTKNSKLCEVHPTLDNPRLKRTLKTLKWWSLEDEGYTHPNCRIRPLTQEGGWLHYRVVKTILFDYEVPFIEYLIGDGAIEKHACERNISETVPSRIRLTPFTDKLLADWGYNIFRLNDTINVSKDGVIVESSKVQVVKGVSP